MLDKTVRKLESDVLAILLTLLVRVSAKELTSLILDEESLRAERSDPKEETE